MPWPPARSVLKCAAWLAAAAACIAVAAGCGTGPTVRSDARLIRLRQQEYRILPATLNVPAGRLRLQSTNTGILTHGLRVQSEGADKRGVQAIYGTGPVAFPGHTVSVTVRLRPGRYKLICPLGNHADLGERATLIVRR